MERTLSKAESIDYLYKIGLNVPEVLITLPKPADTKEYQKYHVYLEEINRVIRKKGINTIVLDNTRQGIDIVEWNKLKEILESSEYGKEGITILKAPQTDTLHRGIVIPGHHYFTASIDDQNEPKKFLWGVWKHYTIKYQKLLSTVSDALTNRKLELDGSAIEFTYHPSGEGVLSQRLVFWGFKRLKYNGENDGGD